MPFRNKARALAGFGLAALLLPLLAAPAGAKPYPASVTVLTRDDFARLNYFSVGDVLDHAVGIDIERAGSRGTAAVARLRGLPDTRSLVIAVDGRPLTHAYDGAVDLSQIPLNSLDRIEITRGGAPVAYGPGAAGVVNLITSRPPLKNWMVDLETGVGRRGVIQHNGRFFDRFHFGDATYIGGLQHSGGFSFNDETEVTTHFANFTRSYGKGGFWGVEYTYAGGFAGTSNGTITPYEQWNGHEERRPVDPSGRREQTIQTAKLLGASPLIAGGTFYADVTRSLRNAAQFVSPDGVKLSDIDRDSLESRVRWESEHMAFGVEENEFTRHLVGAERRDATQAGAFAQGRYQLGEIGIEEGVRYDHHSRVGGGFAARFGSTYRPVPVAVLSVSVQRSARFPTFDALFPVAGSPASLRPERVSDVDLGAVYEDDGIRLSVTCFDTNVERAIGIDPATAAFGNVGKDRSRGVETEGATSFGEGAWRQIGVSANVTVRSAQRKDNGATGFAHAPLSSDLLAGGQISLLLPAAVTMTNELRYQSKQYEFTGQTGRQLPPFVSWNLKFTVKIHTAILYLAAENLGAKRYAESFGSAVPSAGLTPQPFQTFWTGLSVRFLG